ncbi:MAG: endonuclease/exonuclease/phosphatase family protein [Streptosporangiaceae bacterium]
MPTPVRERTLAGLGTGLAANGTVTIVSLNLHCGLSAGGRPYNVVKALTGLDADIIAVQEAWWPAAEVDPVATAAQALGARLIRIELMAGVSLAELNIASRSDRGNWGIAVLSRLPVTSHARLSLGQVAGDEVSRAALICSVTTPIGWPLRLVCTHLSPRLTSPAQLYQLTQYLARTPAPTVIAGDLNMPRLATWLAGGYAPTVRGRTFPSDRPLVQLDHLLASPGLTCLDAAVLPAVGSDHLPVVARFSRTARLAAMAELPV